MPSQVDWVFIVCLIGGIYVLAVFLYEGKDED